MREFAKRHENEKELVHEIEQVHLPVHGVQTVMEHPAEPPQAVVVDHFYDPHYSPLAAEQFRPKLHIDAKKEATEDKGKDTKKESEMHKEVLHADYGTSSTDSEIGKEMTPFEYHQSHHEEPVHHVVEPVHRTETVEQHVIEPVHHVVEPVHHLEPIYQADVAVVPPSH